MALDLTQLAEALAEYEASGEFVAFDPVEVTLLAAARAYLDLLTSGGDTEAVYWCETHKHLSSHERGRCHYSVMKLMQTHPEEVGGCRIVQRFLVDAALGGGQ